MKKNKMIIFICAGALFFCAIFFLIKREKKSYMLLGNNRIKIETANTDKAKYKGLSGRKDLCADCGMLFPFNGLKEPSFVMRDMNFPLDIIWLKENKIIKIDKNLPPEGNNPEKIYTSSEPADMVLEVNGGFCDEKGIREGAEIKKFRN